VSAAAQRETGQGEGVVGQTWGKNKEVMVRVWMADVKENACGRGDVSGRSEKCGVTVWERVVDGCV